MNIVKLQRQLESVPDQALIGYVQNPDGQVPSYLALAEISRRKKVRDEYQQQAAPEQSVAETMVAEAQPQGVAGLPVNAQMFTAPETGIMAPVATAAGGGEVQGHAQEIQRYADGGAVKHYEFGGSVLKGLGALTPLGAFQGAPNSAFLAKKVLETETEYLSRLAQTLGITKEQAADVAKKSPVSDTKLTPADVNQVGKDFVKSYKPEVINKPQVDTAKLGNPPAPAAANVGDPRMQTVSEIGYDLPKVDVKTLDVPEGIKTLDYITQQRQAMADAGVDPNFYGKQQEKLAAEREALKGSKETAGWMALAKAGLGMAAGTSPFALKNLAEGAISGLDQYGRDVKEIKQDEKLLRQADQKLAEAKYMQDRGDAQGALAAMKERENLIFNTKAKNVEIGNQAAIKEADLTGERSKTMFTEQGAERRAAMQIAAQKAISAADNASRERIASLASSLDLSKQQRANIDKVHDNAKAQVKLEIDGGATYTPDQIQKRINELTAGGLKQMGYNIPGLEPKDSAPASGLIPAQKGSGADFRFGF